MNNQQPPKEEEVVNLSPEQIKEQTEKLTTAIIQALEKSRSLQFKAAPSGPLQNFSEHMIEVLKNVKSSDWKQEWTIGDEKKYGFPITLNGKKFSAGNGFALSMDTVSKGYHLPVYGTEKSFIDKGLVVKPEEKEKSVPVLYWAVSILDSKGKSISQRKYDKLSEDEKKLCRVVASPRTHQVYNVDQTTYSSKFNLDEQFGEYFNRLNVREDARGMYINPELDRMMDKQEWVCPIQNDRFSEKGCYYSVTRDLIVTPLKSQFSIGKTPEEVFKDGMEYYSSLIHEMAHSTGSLNRLNRKNDNRFGDSNYVKEELIAELTAANVCSSIGIDGGSFKNSARYIKGWLSAMREDPEYIVSVITDVNKASKMILEKIEEQHKAIAEEQAGKDNLTESLDDTTPKKAVRLPEWIQEGKNIEVWSVSHNADLELQDRRKEKPINVTVTVIDDKYVHYANDEINGMFLITDYAKQARKPAPPLFIDGNLHVISAGQYDDDKKYDVVNSLGELYTHSTRKEIDKQLKTVDIYAAYAAGEIADSIEKAREMKGFPEFPVLVPVPDHSGKATYNRKVCDQISRMTGIFVADFLTGNKHKPLQDLKDKNQDISKVNLGFHCANNFPNKTTPILIDDTLGTGKTLTDAWKALGQDENQASLAFVYADTPNALQVKDVVVSRTTPKGISEALVRENSVQNDNQTPEMAVKDKIVTSLRSEIDKDYTAKVNDYINTRWPVKIPRQVEINDDKGIQDIMIEFQDRLSHLPEEVEKRYREEDSKLRFSAEKNTFVGLPADMKLGTVDKDNDGNIVQMVDDEFHRLELVCPPDNHDKVEIRVFLEPHRDAKMDPDYIADKLADKGYIKDEDVKAEIASDRSFNYVSFNNLDDAIRIFSLAVVLDSGRDIPAKITDGETASIKIEETMNEDIATNDIRTETSKPVDKDEAYLVNLLGEGFHWDWHHSYESKRTDLWVNQDGTIMDEADDPEATQHIQSVDVKDGRLHLVDGNRHRDIPFDSLTEEQKGALNRWIDAAGIREGHAPLIPEEGLVFNVTSDKYYPNGKYVFAFNDANKTKGVAIPLGEPLNRPDFPLHFDSFQRGVILQHFTTERQHISKDELDTAIKDYAKDMANRFHEIDRLPVYEVGTPASKEKTAYSPLNKDQTQFILNLSSKFVYDLKQVNDTLDTYGLAAIEAQDWKVENPVKTDNAPENGNWPYLKDSDFNMRYLLVKALGPLEAEYVYNHQRIQLGLYLSRSRDQDSVHDYVLSQLQHPSIDNPNIPVSTLGETKNEKHVKAELEKKILSRLDEGYVWDYQQYPLQTGPISPYIGDKKEIHNLQIRDKHLLVSIAQSLAPDNRVYASYLPKEDLKRLDRYFEVTGQYKDSKAVMPSTGITFQYKGKNYIIGDVTPPDLEGILVSSCYEIDDKLQRVNKDRVLPDLQLNLQEFQDAIINDAIVIGKNMTRKETERIIKGPNVMSDTEQDVADYLGEGFHWDWKDAKLHGFQINTDNPNDITQPDRTNLALSSDKSVEEITRVDVIDGRVNIASENTYKTGILLSDLSREQQDAFRRWVNFSGIKDGQDEIKASVGQAFQVSTGQNIPWGPYVIAHTNKDESMGLAVPIYTDDGRPRPAFLINKEYLKQRLVDLTFTSPQLRSKEYAVKAEDSHIKQLSNTFYDIDCNDAYKTDDGQRVSLLSDWQADFLKTLAPDRTDGRIDSQMRTYQFVTVDADSWAKAKSGDVPEKFKFYGDSDFDLRPAFERALGEEGAKTLYNQINYQKHIISDHSVLEEMWDKELNGKLKKSGLLGEVHETPKLTVGESFSMKDQKDKWSKYTVAVTDNDGSRGIAVPYGFDESYRPAIVVTAESLQDKYDNQQAVLEGKVSRSTALRRARNHIIETYSAYRDFDGWPVYKTDDGQRFSGFRGSQVNFLGKLSSKENRETMEKLLDAHELVAVDPDKWMENLKEPVPDRFEMPSTPGIDLRPAFERILGTENAARLYNHLTRPLPIITDENTYKAFASMEKAHQLGKHREEGFLGTTEGKRLEDIIVSKLEGRHGKEYHWSSLDEGHFGFTVKTKDNPAFDVLRLDSTDHRITISNRNGDIVPVRDIDPSGISKIDRMLSVTGEYYPHDKIEPEIGTVFATNDPMTNARTSYVVTGTMEHSGQTGYVAKAFDDAINPIKNKLYAFNDKYDFQKAIVDGKVMPYRFIEKEDVERIKKGQFSKQSLDDKKALGDKYTELFAKAENFLKTKERPADVRKIDDLARELVNTFDKYVKASPVTNPKLVELDRKALMNLVNNITTLDYVLDKPQEEKDRLDKIFDKNEGMFFDLSKDDVQHAKTFYMTYDGQRQRVQDWQMAYLKMTHPHNLRIADMDIDQYDYYYRGGKDLVHILPDRLFKDSIQKDRFLDPIEFRKNGTTIEYGLSRPRAGLHDVYRAITAFGMMDEYSNLHSSPSGLSKIGERYDTVDSDFIGLNLDEKVDYAAAKKYEGKTVKGIGLYSADIRIDHIVIRKEDMTDAQSSNEIRLKTTVNTEFSPYDVDRYVQVHSKAIINGMPNNVGKLNTLMARADKYLAQMDPKDPDVFNKKYKTNMLSGGSVQTHFDKLRMMMEVVSTEYGVKRALNTLTDKDSEKFHSMMLNVKETRYASNLAGAVNPDKLDMATRARYDRYLRDGATGFLNSYESNKLTGTEGKDSRKYLLLGSPELHAKRMEEYLNFRNAANELGVLPEEEKNEHRHIIDRLREVAKEMKTNESQTVSISNEVQTPKEDSHQQKEEGQSSYYDFVRGVIGKQKAKNAHTIVLFNSGDLFIAYGKDAETLHDQLRLPIIKADKPDAMDKVSFPHDALDTYLTRMIKNGNRVAVYDPSLDKRHKEPEEKTAGMEITESPEACVEKKAPNQKSMGDGLLPDISKINTNRIDKRENGRPDVYLAKEVQDGKSRFVIGAKINGKNFSREISKGAYLNSFWADDKESYKFALSAVTFSDILGMKEPEQKEERGEGEQVTQPNSEKEDQKVDDRDEVHRGGGLRL
ncbi:MAG: zincin-like metallopeptidase domain-containing protein [Prevotella sp.]|nr:zincin-like metallopeptidase domain-containing protein [Prevotella sp.]